MKEDYMEFNIEEIKQLAIKLLEKDYNPINASVEGLRRWLTKNNYVIVKAPAPGEASDEGHDLLKRRDELLKDIDAMVATKPASKELKELIENSDPFPEIEDAMNLSNKE